MDGVVTVVKSGGQYQVVIGNHVPDVYADIISTYMILNAIGDYLFYFFPIFLGFTAANFNHICNNF